MPITAAGLLLVFLPSLVVFVVLDIAWIALVIGKMYRVSWHPDYLHESSAR